MEKKLLNKEIKIFDQVDPIRWKNIKDFKFEDEDIISVGYDDDDADYCTASVRRQVLETDEEFAKRAKNQESFAIISRKYRLEEYEKLKKEFEP